MNKIKNKTKKKRTSASIHCKFPCKANRRARSASISEKKQSRRSREINISSPHFNAMEAGQQDLIRESERLITHDAMHRLTIHDELLLYRKREKKGICIVSLCNWELSPPCVLQITDENNLLGETEPAGCVTYTRCEIQMQKRRLDLNLRCRTVVA